jgi:hypothetical protein
MESALYSFYSLVVKTRSFVLWYLILMNKNVPYARTFNEVISIYWHIHNVNIGDVLWRHEGLKRWAVRLDVCETLIQKNKFYYFYYVLKSYTNNHSESTIFEISGVLFVLQTCLLFPRPSSSSQLLHEIR